MSRDKQIIVTNDITLSLQCGSDRTIVSGRLHTPWVNQDSLRKVGELLPAIFSETRLPLLNAITQFAIGYGRDTEVSDRLEFLA
jgi:hypothetical protein